MAFCAPDSKLIVPGSHGAQDLYGRPGTDYDAGSSSGKKGRVPGKVLSVETSCWMLSHLTTVTHQTPTELITSLWSNQAALQDLLFISEKSGASAQISTTWRIFNVFTEFKL